MRPTGPKKTGRPKSDYDWETRLRSGSNTRTARAPPGSSDAVRRPGSSLRPNPAPFKIVST